MYARLYVIQCNVLHEEYVNERATTFESTMSPCVPVRRQQTYEEFQLPCGSCAGDGVQLSQRNGISHRRSRENDSSSEAEGLVRLLRYNTSASSLILDFSTMELCTWLCGSELNVVRL